MTDKPWMIEQWAGCSWDGPRPRKAKSVYLGEKFAVSPLNALQPTTGKELGSVKHVKDQN